MTSEIPWLVFDIGTSAVKAALITSRGQILHSLSRSYETHTAPGGLVEQNAEDWWQAALDCIRALDWQKTSIQGVILTGQMQDLILVDATGNLLGPVILYSDTRAQAEAREIQQRISVKRLRNLTGNDQNADSLLAKTLWLWHHHPDALRQAHKLLVGAADFVGMRLTGRTVSDTTTASTTGLIRLHQRAWLDEKFFREAGLDAVPHLLPELVPGGTQIGHITPEAAHLTGLPEKLPVFIAPGDAGAATLGVGSGEVGQAYGYLGTSGWIAFTDHAVGSPEQGVLTLLHPRSDAYIPVAPLLTAGGNLEWVMHQIVGHDDYAQAIERALQREMTSLIYLPYLNGERAPFSDLLARAAYIGINATTTTDDLYRAAMEGVCFAYQHSLDALLANYPNTLLLAGGGTRSKAWAQLFADVLGINVAIAADAENVGVRGALLSVLTANRYYDSYQPRGFFPTPTVLKPDMQRHRHYARKYQIFRAAYPALKQVFALQAQL